MRLIQVSRKDMQATLALRFGGEGILKMKGIPFRAGAAEVRHCSTWGLNGNARGGRVLCSGGLCPADSSKYL